jgi:hypothetical protein
MEAPVVCVPKRLPPEMLEKAADTAAAINPLNRAPVHRLMRIMPGFTPTKAHLSVLTTKYWGVRGVRLTVGFLDNPSSDLRKRIMLHMNAWAKTANVTFVRTRTDPQVRIARTPNDGHWSYLGTDVLLIPRREATMNLDSFTMATPESEYKRVVRHEAGHTLGFPHEHMRRQLVALIDPDKAIAFFGRTQGWSPDEVRRQVLTPLEESSLRGTVNADPRSIMCYQIPGSITKSGEPIVGGLNIDQSDYQFAALIYPRFGAQAARKTVARKKAAKKKAVKKRTRAGRKASGRSRMR